MRISAKGRYALASMVVMAQHYTSGEYITVISISERLGISKIYLEQVFSLLKRGGLVTSVKGAQGGYQLTRTPQQITLLDIMRSVEISLFEIAEETVSARAPEIEAALKASAFDPLDQAIQTVWQSATLEDLMNEAEKHKTDDGLMFFI